MSERDFSIPREYRRTVSRAEIFAERLDEYRRAFPAGPINTWAEVIEGQRARVKSLRAMGRLKRQLTEFSDSAPDLSNSLLGLQYEVTRLAIIDKEIGLGEERWDYDSKISQFRGVKRYEERRSSGFPDFQVLLKQSEQLPTSNNRLFINEEDRQIVFGDRLVAIKQDRDWKVFLHIVRNRSKDILPQEIEKIARDNGVEDSQAAANSIRRLRRLLESDPARPEIITTNNPSKRDASYSFSLKNVRFYRPSQEINNSRAPENLRDAREASGKNVLDMDAYRQRVVPIERIYPETREVVNLILDDLARKGITRPITGLQLYEYYRFLTEEFMKEIYSKGYVKPVRSNDYYHPAYTTEDVATALFIRGFKKNPNIENYNETEDGQKSINRRQVRSQQVRQLRRIIGQEISKRVSSAAK